MNVMPWHLDFGFLQVLEQPRQRECVDICSNDHLILNKVLSLKLQL